MIFLGCLKISWTDLPYAYVLSVLPGSVVLLFCRGSKSHFGSVNIQTDDI